MDGNRGRVTMRDAKILSICPVCPKCFHEFEMQVPEWVRESKQEHDKRIAAESRAQQLEARVMEWVSVEERFPNDKEIVDIWTVDNIFGGNRITEVTYDATEKMFNEFRIIGDRYRVTHWMKLPDAPKITI